MLLAKSCLFFASRPSSHARPVRLLCAQLKMSNKKAKNQLSKAAQRAKQNARAAAKAEILLPEQAGYEAMPISCLLRTIYSTR